MDLDSIEVLTRQDRMTSYFGPYGLSTGGPILTPDASLRWLQEIVAPYDLCERVPEGVRSYYEVARRLHVYGFFEYRFFTIATERVTFAAEFAVRRRLLDWYDGRVPLERGEGPTTETTAIETTDTWRFDSEFRRRHRRRSETRWHLTGHPDFDGSFRAHLEWARATFDLGIYFTQARLSALADLRNLAAHPSIDMRVGPPDSSRDIESTWRFINALWGIPTQKSFY